jgi:peptide deformylase
MTSRRIVTIPSASSLHHRSPSTFWTSPFTLFSASSSSTTTDEEIDPGIVPGTNLRVLKYPHPSLRAPNTLIDMSELTGPGCEISRIVKEMFLVMYASHGCGLAAPQVGINRRLMVYNESGDPKDWMGETVMINPTIIEYSTGTDIEEEGCLSFPKIRAKVVRPKWIKIEAVNLKGKKFKKKFVGWEARIFQHEYDHLDGTVFIDRLSEDIRKDAQPTLDGLIASFGEGGAL